MMAHRRPSGCVTRGLTKRDLGIGKLLRYERAGFEREGCWQQSRRSFILVIWLFAIYSLLCLSLSSVVLETEGREVSATPVGSNPPPYKHVAPPPSNQQGSPLASPSPVPGSAPSPSNGQGSPLASPSPAPDQRQINSRFNSEEIAGMILAAFAALLQVVVVTYLLAKRRQMLGMVCDYDPRERHRENHRSTRN